MVLITRPPAGSGSGRRLPGCRPEAVSSATVPDTFTAPSSTMNTWSASVSASSMAWVVSTMLTPEARNSRSSSQVARRACGSMPGGRLVEEDQLRPADQRTGQIDRLLLAARELAVGGSRVPADAEPLDDGRHRQRVRVQAREIAEQLDGPDPGPGAGALWHQTDAGGIGRRSRRIAEHFQRAGRRASAAPCSSGSAWSCRHRWAPGSRSAPRCPHAGSGCRGPGADRNAPRDRRPAGRARGWTPGQSRCVSRWCSESFATPIRCGRRRSGRTAPRATGSPPAADTAPPSRSRRRTPWPSAAGG